MKLSIAARSVKKSETAKLRREGKIPAVLYSKGEKGKEFSVDAIEFKKILNTTPTGTLSSKVFSLEAEGKTIRAIVKDIQYNVTTYDVIHLDFQELFENQPVKLKIPLVCINVADCVGVKLGGTVRQVVRHLPATCDSFKTIPDQIEIDVREMNLGQTKKLRDLKIPKGVHPAMDLKEVAVVIARK